MAATIISRRSPIKEDGGGLNRVDENQIAHREQRVAGLPGRDDDRR